MRLRHFSIRDLLWLFVVVALATGWALDRFKLEAARRNETVERQRLAAVTNYVAAQTLFAQSQAAAANQSLQLGATILDDDVQYFPPAPESKTAALIRTTLAAPEATGGADDVQRLLRERLGVLEEVVALHVEAYEAGIRDLKPLLDARRDVAEAKVELATTAAERVAALEELVAGAKEVEKGAIARFEIGAATRLDSLVAKAFRLRAESDLAREKAKK